MPPFIDASTSAATQRGSVVTIGNFDGVHRGHQVLVDAAVTAARARRLPAVALTFEPHPATWFGRRDPAQFRIQSSDERERTLSALGITDVATAEFGDELAGLSCEDFVTKVLRDGLHAAAVHVGHDFRFGRGRSGNAETLIELCTRHGIAVTVHSQYNVDAEAASSTRLRDALRAGDLVSFAKIAGRRYAITGTVESGAGLGRTIGIPTLNLYPVERLLPPFGVYATQLHVDGIAYDAITNLGVRPTFAGDPRTSLETHVLSEKFPLNPAQVEVDFVAFVRPEQRFEGAEALVAQIAIDKHVAQAALLASREAESSVPVLRAR